MLCFSSIYRLDILHVAIPDSCIKNMHKDSNQRKMFNLTFWKRQNMLCIQIKFLYLKWELASLTLYTLVKGLPCSRYSMNNIALPDLCDHCQNDCDRLLLGSVAPVYHHSLHLHSSVVQLLSTTWKLLTCMPNQPCVCFATATTNYKEAE